ncbi:MAG: DUF47 domain-containing protein [Promethearchaeota archaeon]
MSSLLKSLRKKTMAGIIKDSKAHIKKSAECVMSLRSAFKKIKLEEFEEGKSKLNAIDDLERQADGIRRSILLSLSHSEIKDKTRESLAHLIKNIDRIANTANGAARIFSHMPNNYFKILFKENDFVIKMLDTSVDAVDQLIQMIDDLMGPGKNIDDFNNKIQKLEHEVDVYMGEIFDNFMNLSEQVPPFVAIQIAKGINYIEKISDAIEDTADYIKVVTIHSK